MRNFSNSYTKFVFGLEQINEAAANSPEEFVNSMEEMFRNEISDLADYVLRPDNKCKILMLAGPSSSGKTTTAYKLRDELIRRGTRTIIISLDDFYWGNGKAPVLIDGKHDYEAVEALDIQQVKDCLYSLMKNGYCDAPKFDFKLKTQCKDKNHIELGENDIAIIEGLHALNPIFTANLPKEGLLKAYISVKQGIKDYNGVVFSRRDVRLIRRLARDFKSRGSDAEETFSMWDSVGRGEFLYIHPFKRTSDITVNSIHIYEPCVLCHQVIPLLKTIDSDSAYFKFSRKILSSLERFYPIDMELVPKNSLIREFIGGGIY